MPNISMSASQEIDLLAKADTLKKLFISLGFQQPLRLLTYHCIPDLTPIGLALLGYEVQAVNSNGENTRRIKRYVDMMEQTIHCDTYPVLEIGRKESQTFDGMIIDGAVITELNTDSQLQDVCQQLITTLRPDGLLIITTAVFDETLGTRERILQPIITDDNSGRQLEITVRDWHGNGYEYTESHYRIKHNDNAPTIDLQQYQRRAWRNAELTLALTQVGFEEVIWQTDEQYSRVMTAKKSNPNASD